MKIYNTDKINKNYTKPALIKNDSKVVNEAKNYDQKNILGAYPKNYYLSFEGKSASGIYEAYKDEMPVTVREFIENSLSKELKEKINTNGFAICHMLAFSKLEDCETIADIKRAYPNEEAFSNLKNLKEVEGNGLFGQLSKLEKQGVQILNNNEDVTVFLVKKIYLECKTLKDVFNDFYEALTPQVKENFLKDYFDNITEERKSNALIYKSLGINPPNGRTYGASVRYTNPGYLGKERKAFQNLDANETNEKIKKFLDDSDLKAKYSMIDAWNNCVEIREKLSEFLSEYLNDAQPYGDIQEEGSDLTIYDSAFYTKMHKVMVDFWNKYPEYKEKLGDEVRKAHLKYDLMANLGKDELNKFISEIESKSAEIRKQIQLNKINKENQYPFAIQLMSIFIEKSKILGFTTKSSLQNVMKMLLPKVSQEELSVLEKGETNSESFKQLVPEGLKAKLRAVIKTSEFTNISNSHHIAFLEELFKKNLSDEEIQEILQNAAVSLNSTVASLADNKLVQSLDMNNIEVNFNINKAALTKMEAQEVKNALLERNLYFNYLEEDKLDRLIKTQGRYLKLILIKNKLQDLTEILFWKEYDKLYSTNYAQKISNNIAFEKIIKNAIKEVNDIDASNIEFGW